MRSKLRKQLLRRSDTMRPSLDQDGHFAVVVHGHFNAASGGFGRRILSPAAPSELNGSRQKASL
jgi:hypothetical protein